MCDMFSQGAYLSQQGKVRAELCFRVTLASPVKIVTCTTNIMQRWCSNIQPLMVTLLPAGRANSGISAARGGAQLQQRHRHRQQVELLEVQPWQQLQQLQQRRHHRHQHPRTAPPSMARPYCERTGGVVAAEARIEDEHGHVVQVGRA